MRLRAGLVAALLLFLTTPSWAVKNWYDYYLDARDKDIASKNWVAAAANLDKAIRLKPESAQNQQTYGLHFIDYYPYYYKGLAHLRMGDHATALKYLNIEQDKGVIKKDDHLFRDLVKAHQEAELGVNRVLEDDRAKQVRLLREEVDRLRKESADLHRTGRFDDALARLAQAGKLAEALSDPAIQREIGERVQKIRDDATRVTEDAARVVRVEKELAEGERLLGAGDTTGAKLRFDTVLTLDPQNAKALAGRQQAEEIILASTNEASRKALLVEGKAHFEAGRFEESLRPLAEAAADPRGTEAQRLLADARKAIEGMRKQKELRQKIDTLLPEAERLLEERRYSDAMVRLESVLELDRTNVHAQERLRFAERMTADDIISRIFPNRPPALTFFEPRTAVDAAPTEVEEKKVIVVGVATDDRGVARVAFSRGGRVIAEQTSAPDPETGELARNVPFQKELDLDEGANDIKVTVTDSMGLANEQAFVVVRKLRPIDRPWFWPSAAGAAVGLVGLGLFGQRLRRRRAVRNRFNPYIAGAPVRAQDMFFGRQKLLARILNVLHHNSLMITGERRIGKTSFLHHLKRALETDEGTEFQFFPVTTDLQGVPESAFFHAVMSDVVETLRPSGMDLLRYRPETEVYEGRDFSHDLQRVVEELATRTPRRVKLALLIDEVDVLNEYSERINQRLRSIFMKTFSEHLVAVMSGVGIKRIWKSEGSPWYNFFDEIELSAFSREEAEALIRQPVEGVFRYEPEAVERILTYSALKPYVIQKFCIHAVNRMLEEGRTTITVADVESVKETVNMDAGESGDGAEERRAGERRASA